MSISMLSENLKKMATTVAKTSNRKCVLVLALNEDQTMELGYSDDTTLHIMGLLGWALTAMGQKCANVDG